MALDRGGYNLRRLLAVCPMNAVETRKNNEGYTYHEDLGLSIQGPDANRTAPGRGRRDPAEVDLRGLAGVELEHGGDLRVSGLEAC